MKQHFLDVCYSGSMMELKKAIADGANVNDRYSDDRTPLMSAAKNNPDPQIISALIEAGADVHAADSQGMTPLMFAAYNHSPVIISILVGAGADVNATDDATGKTPLMYAVLKTKVPAVIKTLLDVGAEVGVRDKEGNSAFDYLERREKYQENKYYYLGKETLKRMRETLAAREQLGKNFRAFLEIHDKQEGAEFDAEFAHEMMTSEYKRRQQEEEINFTENFELRFHGFCGFGFGSLEEAKELIAAGADVNARFPDDAETPLMLVVMNNKYPEVISEFIEAGAEVNAVNPFGMTPLMYAAQSRWNLPEVASILINAGSDINATDSICERTPLMYSAMRGTSPGVMAVLIAAGADPNAKDGEGDTVLNYLEWREKHNNLDGETLETLQKMREIILRKMFEIVIADIVSLDVEAIVNSAHASLLRGGGISGYIHTKAGAALEEECVAKYNGCETGKAVLTGGHALKSKYVIHTVGPKNYEPDKEEKLYDCYYNSLLLAKENGIKSVAFPSISTGIHGYPLDEAATIAIGAIFDFLKERGTFEKIFLACASRRDYEAYMKAREGRERNNG